MSTKVAATIEDLYKVEGKAELVNGEIILMSPTGRRPGYAGDEIFSHYANTPSATKSELLLATTKRLWSIFPIVSPLVPTWHSISVPTQG